MIIDTLTALRHSLSPVPSRRGLLAGLGAAVLAGSSHELAAKGKRNGNGKGKRKKRKQRNGKNDPPAAPQARADAQCANPNGGAVDGTPEGRVAQTFTALQSGELVRAELLFVVPDDSLGDYFLHLAPVDAFGFPSNGVLATASGPGVPDPNNTPTVQTFTFPQPATVVAGTQYALVLSRPEVGIVGWQARLDNGCAGRTFASDTLTSPFVGVGQNVDLIFTTFVRA